MTSREICMASRPNGIPTAANFSIARTELKPLQAGEVKDQGTGVKGIEHAVDAFIGLFQGQNAGKMVVELA